MPLPRIVRSICLTFSLVAVSQRVATQAPGVDLTAEQSRPKIGLVLGGGGARGAAHIGVLKVLEELRVPFDVIVGNSMGALVGAIYAYGRSAAELEEIMTGIDWAQVLTDRARRQDISFRRKQDDATFLLDLELGFRDFEIVFPRGLVQGHYTLNTLKSLIPRYYEFQHFDELRIPFRAVATDIGSGELVVLESGNLPRAMLASMAIPGVFSPVHIDGRDLVDGMVVDNVPVDVAKAMGTDVLIVVNVSGPLMDAEEIATPIDVAAQMLNILMEKNVTERLALLVDRDVLITPALEGMGSGDFARVADAVADGEAAAWAVADKLRRYSVSTEQYAQFLAKQRRPRDGGWPLIDKLVIRNTSALGDGAILGRMDTRVGQQLRPDILERDIDRIYGLEDFEKVTWDLEQTPDGQNELHILADAKTWGPSYLRFGINLEDDLSGNASYNLGFNYTMRTLNELGGEWRTEVQFGKYTRVFSEFYQPLTEAGWFLAPQFEHNRLPVNQLQGGALVAQYDVRSERLGVDVGTPISNWAEVRVGIGRIVGDVEVEFSTFPQSDYHFDDAEVSASLQVDTLDNINFPAVGTSGMLAWDHAVSDLGADISYQRLALNLGQARTFSNSTFVLAGNFGTALDGTLPAHRLFEAGGFLNLSGLAERELTGQHMGVVKLIFYRQISGDRVRTFGMPVYLGGSIEYGGVAARRSDLLDNARLAGSVFLGVDSPLGPIYLGYGRAEGGRDSAYLYLGRTF